MKKFVLFLMLGILLIVGFPNIALAAQPIDVFLNGEKLKFDVSPVIENNRLLVPLRTIFTAIGAEVLWDNSINKVTIKDNDNYTLNLLIGYNFAYKNNRLIKLNVPFKIVDGRTLAPIILLSEALGAYVNYDNANGKVMVFYNANNFSQLKSKGHSNSG